MFRRKSADRLAFTLTETMVAVAIGVVLFGITIAYSRSSNNQLSLFTEQARLIGFLNRAKAFALEKRASAPGEDICAFGVHYQPPVGGANGQMILFKDLAQVGLNCPDGANGEFDGPAEVKEILPLDAKAVIAAFPGNILFEPPYLQTGYVPNYNELGLIQITVGADLAVCVAVGPGGTIYKLDCPADFVPVEPPVNPL